MPCGCARLLLAEEVSVGGLARNRTGIEGFAVLCVTIPPRGLCRDEPRAGPSAIQRIAPHRKASLPPIASGSAGVSALQRWRGLVICAREKNAIPDSSAGRAIDC